MDSLNKFVALRDQMLEASLTPGHLQNIEPCIIGIANRTSMEQVKATLDHVQEHGEAAIDEAIAKELAGLKLQNGTREFVAQVARQMMGTAEAPPYLAGICEESFAEQTAAVEVCLLFSLLPMLAATADEKAFKHITFPSPAGPALRRSYQLAWKLAHHLLARYYPMLTLPSLPLAVMG